MDVGEQWRELKGIMMRGSASVLESREVEAADPRLAAAQLNLGSKHELTREGVTVPYAASASGKSRRWIVFTPRSSSAGTTRGFLLEPMLIRFAGMPWLLGRLRTEQ